jgi:signal transduction histidine kinase
MAEVNDLPQRLLIRTDCQENGYVRLSVRDAGVGLDGRTMDKLFDSFYTKPVAWVSDCPSADLS